MSIHYDRKAEYSANRKTLASHARNIEAEKKEEWDKNILKVGLFKTTITVGEIYCFDEQKMYEVLTSNPICQKVCEKQKYNNWHDIIIRFS